MHREASLLRHLCGALHRLDRRRREVLPVALVEISRLRAEAQLSARRADSISAADLLRIARDQLEADVGVAWDVTRAASQLASA